MDDFIDRIRHVSPLLLSKSMTPCMFDQILLASLDVIRTCPKLAAILKEMNGIQ